MLPPITVRHPVRPARRSLATARVADLFGLAAAEPDHVVADGLALDVRPGDVVLVTGPSGSGKSSVLRELGRRLGAVDVNGLSLPDVPLVDALPGPIDDRLATLAGCGLGEARLLHRTPAELSDGQRHRFRLALAMSQRPGWVLADEFGAVLDRPLAKVLAYTLRKLAARAGVGVLAATTHDDLTADLAPDLWVRCLGDGRVAVERQEAVVKKKWSASPATCGCPPAPAATGRTSLGGITADTNTAINRREKQTNDDSPDVGLHAGYTDDVSTDLLGLVQQLGKLNAAQRQALLTLLSLPTPTDTLP